MPRRRAAKTAEAGRSPLRPDRMDDARRRNRRKVESPQVGHCITRLHPNERLQQTPQRTGESDVSLQRHQANALLAGFDPRPVLHRLVGVFDIAWAIAAVIVPKRTLKHAGQLGSRMAVTRKLCSGLSLQHEHVGPGLARHRDPAIPHAASDPSPGTERVVR